MWTGHGPEEEQQDVTCRTMSTEVNKEKKLLINMEATHESVYDSIFLLICFQTQTGYDTTHKVLPAPSPVQT